MLWLHDGRCQRRPARLWRPRPEELQRDRQPQRQRQRQGTQPRDGRADAEALSRRGHGKFSREFKTTQLNYRSILDCSSGSESLPDRDRNECRENESWGHFQPQAPQNQLQKGGLVTASEPLPGKGQVVSSGGRPCRPEGT